MMKECTDLMQKCHLSNWDRNIEPKDEKTMNLTMQLFITIKYIEEQVSISFLCTDLRVVGFLFQIV